MKVLIRVQAGVLVDEPEPAESNEPVGDTDLYPKLSELDFDQQTHSLYSINEHFHS